MATALSPAALQAIWSLTTYGKSVITDGYTITNYPTNIYAGDTFTIPAITPDSVFLGEDDDEDEESEEEKLAAAVKSKAKVTAPAPKGAAPKGSSKKAPEKSEKPEKV